MARHLAGKVSRLIGDFRTIDALVMLIEHEMEKRIVARHGLVKLDALLNLLPRYKNEIRQGDYGGAMRPLEALEGLIKRLRDDYHQSELETGRDAMAAHALKLDLLRIVETWKFMGATTFGVLLSDLDEIDAELGRVARDYVAAGTAQVEPGWKAAWRQLLGAPDRPRCAVIYPGLGTAGIVAPIAGGHPAQDADIRAVGLATFLRQTLHLLQPMRADSTAARNLAEIMLNDYIALWELLFTSHVTNEHGTPDKCILDHWRDEAYGGAECLAALKLQPHPHLESWRTDVRNKISAHVDADLEIWKADLAHWPFTIDELANEALRVIERFRACADRDLVTKTIFMKPTELGPGVVGLTGQEGRMWSDG